MFVSPKALFQISMQHWKGMPRTQPQPCPASSHSTLKLSSCHSNLSNRDGLKNTRNFWPCLLKGRHVHWVMEFFKLLLPLLNNISSKGLNSFALAQQSLYMDSPLLRYWISVGPLHGNHQVCASTTDFGCCSVWQLPYIYSFHHGRHQQPSGQSFLQLPSHCKSLDYLRLTNICLPLDWHCTWPPLFILQVVSPPNDYMWPFWVEHDSYLGSPNTRPLSVDTTSWPIPKGESG